MKRLFIIVLALSANLLAFSLNKSYLVQHVKFNIDDLHATYPSLFPSFDIESTTDDCFQLEFEQKGYQYIKMYRNEKLIFKGYLERRDERNLIQIDHEGDISINSLYKFCFDGYVWIGGNVMLNKFTRKEDGKFDQIEIIFPKNGGGFCESEIILEGLTPVEKTIEQKKEEKRLEEKRQAQLKEYNAALEGKKTYLPQIKSWRISSVINIVEDGDCVPFTVDTLGNITYTGDSERGKMLFELLNITPRVPVVNFDILGKKLKVVSSGTLIFDYILSRQDETLTCSAHYDKNNGWKVNFKGGTYTFSEKTYMMGYLADIISCDKRFQDTSKKYQFDATPVSLRINVKFKDSDNLLESEDIKCLIKNLKSK